MCNKTSKQIAQAILADIAFYARERLAGLTLQLLIVRLANYSDTFRTSVLFKKSQNSLESHFDKQEVMLGKLYACVTRTRNGPDQSVNITALQNS